MRVRSRVTGLVDVVFGLVLLSYTGCRPCNCQTFGCLGSGHHYGAVRPASVECSPFLFHQMDGLVSYLDSYLVS